MALKEHKINDFTSFEAATVHLYEIAGLYFYQQLDCIVDLAEKISCDFFARPHLYTNLGTIQPNENPDANGKSESNGNPQANEKLETNAKHKPRQMPQILAELHSRSGHHELFPSTSQREEIFKPIFGSGGIYSTGEEGDFPRLRDALRAAAAAYAERVFDTGEEMLRERFVSTTRIFRQYLRGLRGDSIRWSREQTLAGLTEDYAYAIFRSARISGIFGIAKPPSADWPYKEDANGDKLVEAISRQLGGSDRPDAHFISREEFLNRQRAALRGAEAIASNMDLEDSPLAEDAKEVIKRSYTWGSALLIFAGDSNSSMARAGAYSGTSKRLAEIR